MPLYVAAVIKKCRKQDLDPDRPKSEQKYCLYTADESRLLGRHPTKEDAYKQESAIRARSFLLAAKELVDAT